MDFRYIVQKAGIMDKVSIEKKVNPTRSGGSDKGRSVAQDENEAYRIMRSCQKPSKFQAILVPCRTLHATRAGEILRVGPEDV